MNSFECECDKASYIQRIRRLAMPEGKHEITSQTLTSKCKWIKTNDSLVEELNIFQVPSLLAQENKK